jgi:DNA-binding GntR family transcriptional regulator
MDSVAVSFSIEGSTGPRTLTSAVLERLRSDILSTKLVPGQKLHIAGLAKQFGVSLAAVREALSRLVADGLVQASDQRGFRVSPVSSADLADVTQTRIDIESLALRRSIERGDAAWLAAVEKAFVALGAVSYRDPDDPQSHNEVWISRHRTFHRALVSACGSHWCLAFAMSFTNRASATGGCRCGARPERFAMSNPNTPRSSAPCSGAIPMPRSPPLRSTS